MKRIKSWVLLIYTMFTCGCKLLDPPLCFLPEALVAVFGVALVAAALGVALGGGAPLGVALAVAPLGVAFSEGSWEPDLAPTDPTDPLREDLRGV